MLLRDDLERESLKFFKHELEQMVETQQRSIDKHGDFLTSTADDQLSKLKTAAQLNKCKRDAAQHLLTFFSLGNLDSAITLLTESIKEQEDNNKGDK